MTLTETLTFTLGPTIAKALLKIWLKNNELAIDAASTITDVLTKQTQDLRARQSTKRQLEAIGERIADSLLPIIQSERAINKDEDRIYVIEQVAETLGAFRLTSDLVVQKDIDPMKLSSFIVSLRPEAVDGMSEAQSSFYRRIIAECSQCVQDISVELPRFTVRAFAEVLGRENRLIDISSRILEEVQRIREYSLRNNPDAADSLFETEYLRSVVRNLDVVELYGADLSASSKRYKLSVAYVTLSVGMNTSVARMGFSHANKGREIAVADETSDHDAVLTSVDSALVSSERLFLVGDAGSGKTTLVQWVAVNCGSHSFAGQMSAWNDSVPFLVRLRDYANSQLPSPEDFPKAVAPAVAGMMPDQWVHKQLITGRACVLVDGVDEIPRANREDVRKWLIDLCESYPNAQYLVTSRPNAVPRGWLHQEGFAEADLQPMQLADIFSFVEHWHDAVRDELRDTAEVGELDVCEAHLQEVVRSTRVIRELATSPLLCSMLCALNRDRRRQLPSDRVELYDACCYMLVERRDLERGVPLQDYPLLNYRQKRLLLEDLAYWLIRNGRSMVPWKEAVDCIARKLTNIQEGTSAHDVLRLLVDRTGMLRQPIPGRVHFAHKTFQEFLAARAALDHGDAGLLVKHAHDDQWREVIILAVGLGNKPDRRAILTELMARGDRERQYQQWLHLLAVACLETAVEVDTDVKAEINDRLGRLFPPKDSEQVKSLVLAGELALPYLSRCYDLDSHVAIACVVGIAKIAASAPDAALDAIERFAHTSRPAITNELLRVWDSFDRREYARRVLSITLRGRRTLKLGSIASLDGVEFLRDIEGLDVRGSSITDLSPACELRSLKNLNLSKCRRILNLSCLNALTELTTLSVEGCWSLESLSGIENLVNLCELKTRDCREIRDIDALSKLSKLSALDLSGCAKLSNLQPLAQLVGLRELDLSNSPILDLRPLRSLTELTTLSVEGCWSLESLSGIENLVNLCELKTRDCREIRDIDALSKLSKLSALDLSGCAKLSNLQPLAQLVGLRELDLSNCREIRDLTPLQQLNGLLSLCLDRCAQLETLTGIGALSQLSAINLRRCAALRDLSALRTLTSISRLDLSYCTAISDLTPVAQMPNLQVLCLTGCTSIERLHPLANLKSLRALIIINCRNVHTLYPLADLPNIENIYMYGLSSEVKVPLKILDKGVHVDKYSQRQTGDLEIFN